MQDAHERNADRTRHALPVAALLLACGFLLRLYFLRQHAFFSTDSILYQDIALNWLHHHIYGLSWQPAPRPTLIRLPGYPAILAAMAWLFDRGQQTTPGTLQSFLPVLWLQIVTDLATCGLVGLIAHRMGDVRCGFVALAIACVCPFTANYAVTPLTETFTLFFLVLAFYLLQCWLHDGRMRWVVLLAVAISFSALLRPDQGLLGVAILPVLLAGRGTLQQRLRPLMICVLLAAVPFGVWTARNYRVFHVFQPIAPKQAVDPGEAAPVHFEKWFRTWGLDYTSTQDAYWNYPEDPIDVNDLPPRAFDSPEQRQQTAALLQRAAHAGKLDAQVEADFETLAQQRIAAHPMRYYVLLPVGRVVNMNLHPRTEILPIAERWWQYQEHPTQTLVATAFGLLNLAYVLAALAGFRSVLKRERLLALSMAAYIVLRCLLLLTLDNPEQRYTLEFLPLWMVFAAGLCLHTPARETTYR